MKKQLLLGILFLTACLSPSGGQSMILEPSSIPEATGTRVVPTPAPATKTPTDTPAPSSTPLPPKRYFTKDFDKTLTYWSTLFASGDSDRVDILNENGTLTFELYRSNAWLYAIYGAFEYENVHLETQVESLGSDVNAMGLVCKYDEQDGWYEFNISNDGTYNVLYGEWLAEEIAHYIPIFNDLSERIETGKASNQFGLDCYEDILQLYINSKLIRKLNVAHIGLTGGKVGLSIASFDEAPVILSFDWVKVSKIESP